MGRLVGRARGFTLVELMITVAIIAILAVLAIPTMSRAQADRHVYGDAAQIAELVRAARTRAVGRGAAVLLDLRATTESGAGTYRMYEAVGPNPGMTAALGEVPASSCKSPTTWPGAGGASNARYVDAVDLAAPYEVQNAIAAQLVDASGTALASGAHAYLCFTPGGRVYYREGVPAFDGVSPLGGGLRIDVRRFDGDYTHPVGLTRSVWITGAGTARVVSR